MVRDRKNAAGCDGGGGRWQPMEIGMAAESYGGREGTECTGVMV